MNYNEANKLKRPLEREELESMFALYVGRLGNDIVKHIDSKLLTKVLCHVIYKKLREEEGLQHRYAILKLHRIFGLTERVLYKWFEEHQSKNYKSIYVIIV